MRTQVVFTLAALCVAAAAHGAGAKASAHNSSSNKVETVEPGSSETRVCPGCGATILATATFCPDCHRYLPDAKVTLKKRELTPEEKRREQIRRIPKPTSGALFFGGRGGLITVSGGAAFGGQGLIGIRLGRQGVAALGIGYQKWPNANAVPVNVLLRRYFFRESASPFVFLRGGYDYAKLIDYWTDANGKPLDGASGVTVLTGVGVAIGKPLGVNVDIDAGIGMSYFTQWVRYYYPYYDFWGEPFSETKTALAFGLGLGLTN